MHQQQQHQHKMIRKRAGPVDSLTSTSAGETSPPAAPTSTSKTTTSHTSTSTSTTPSSTSTPVQPKSTTTTSTTTTSSSSSSSSSSSTTSSTSSTSTTSSSSTTSSTISTTSTSSLNLPTTMTGLTTAPGFSNGLLPSHTLTSPASDPSQTSDGNDTNTSGNVATNHPSSGTIVAIVAGSIAGVAALLILTCFIRRKLRTKHRRGADDWTNRASFMRNSIALPDDGMDSGRPVIGTRNALALARANMGHNPEVGESREAEMTQTYNHPVAADSYAPNNWGTQGNNAHAEYSPYQDHYNQQQYAQPGYNVQDSHDPHYQQYQQYDQHGATAYGYHEQSGPHDEKYADLARQLEVPPVALTAPAHNAHDTYANGAGRTSPPAANLGRTLSTSAYGSLSAHEPSPSHPTRSGTPVDHNPQQAYLAPGLQTRNGSTSLHSRSSVYSEDDAYGGM